MTIAFTGGGSGGHFTPIIAIVEALNDLVREDQLIAPKLYYLAPNPYDEKALFENGITYVRIPAGKMRRYASLRNLTDSFVTFTGMLYATLTLFRLYPDVVVSKGGYGSVPTVLAARLLRIPVIIHESDALPGRANLMASKFAEKIAVSFEGSEKYFPKKVQKRIARTGIPIRKALMRVETEGAQQYLKLENNIPTIFIIGGSQGSVRINESVISALPDLVSFANIIHQTGEKNLKNVEAVAQVALAGSAHADRYHPISYLSEVALQRAAGVANVVISRAGSTGITEISFWKKPAILIPIPESISHDQRSNAYAYARTGAAVVIDEENLSPHLLTSEIHRILNDRELAEKMSTAAEGFADPDAAYILAKEILATALQHES